MNTKEERTAGGRRDAWKRREGTYTERQIQAPIAYHGTQPCLFCGWSRLSCSCTCTIIIWVPALRSSRMKRRFPTVHTSTDRSSICKQHICKAADTGAHRLPRHTNLVRFLVDHASRLLVNRPTMMILNRARSPICIWSYGQCSKWTPALGYMFLHCVPAFAPYEF